MFKYHVKMQLLPPRKQCSHYKASVWKMHWVQIDTEFPSKSFRTHLNFRANSYCVRWTKGLCMAVNNNIKGLHHDRWLFKSTDNGHYVTSTLWKNLPNCFTNSIKPNIPLGAWCRYSFVKQCTYILLCMFVCKTSLLLDQKCYSTWLSALQDMRSVRNYFEREPFCNCGSPQFAYMCPRKKDE
jgi:hypothetical protein